MITVTLFVLIEVIFLITTKSESYTCNDENMQFVIVNDPTFSINSAGDFERDDP